MVFVPAQEVRVEAGGCLARPTRSFGSASRVPAERSQVTIGARGIPSPYGPSTWLRRKQPAQALGRPSVCVGKVHNGVDQSGRWCYLGADPG
jgi:hypothetical protein